MDERLAAFVVASHHRSHPDRVGDVAAEVVEHENTNQDSGLQLGFDEEQAEAGVCHYYDSINIFNTLHKLYTHLTHTHTHILTSRQRTDLLRWTSSCCGSTLPMRRPTSTRCCTTWIRRRSPRCTPTSEASLLSREVLTRRSLLFGSIIECGAKRVQFLVILCMV